MRKLPPLNALRAFEAAARHQSFSLAAAELHVTHGAVSRQVALLEQWLGAPLFDRTRTQVSLNAAGQQYAPEATAALDRIAVASAQMQEHAVRAALARSAVPSLLVSAPPTFSMRWLIPRMGRFRFTHQGRSTQPEIKLTTSLAPVDFKANSYDLAIRGAAAPERTGHSHAFMTEIIVPVCHVNLLKRSGRVVLKTPADLAQQTLISYATEPLAWRVWLTSVGAGKIKPNKALHFEQMYFALQAAAEGLGVVLVPLFLVADDIISGRLCAPFGLLGAKQRRYYASAAGPMPAVPLVAAFTAWLVQEGQDTERSITAWAKGMGW